LQSAYSRKIRDYVRTFCFLNLDNVQTPAVLIVLDNMTTAKAEFQKYWQVNTLNPPEQTADGVVLRNRDLGRSGKVTLRMLRPTPAERRVEILSGAAANSVFGQPFTAPYPTRPEGNGHRVMFTPKTARAHDVFLAVMSISDDQARALPVSWAETSHTLAVTLSDRCVELSKTGRLIDRAFQIAVAPPGNRQLLLTGLAPGTWGIRSAGGEFLCNVCVAAGKNTAFLLVPAGSFHIQPQAIPGAPEYRPPATCMPSCR